VTIRATLEELYIGAVNDFTLTRNVYCKECKGSGAEGGDFKTCPTCKGKGQTMQIINMGGMQMQM
jgi:DnaJ-class molecular chaperone